MNKNKLQKISGLEYHAPSDGIRNTPLRLFLMICLKHSILVLSVPDGSTDMKRHCKYTMLSMLETLI